MQHSANAYLSFFAPLLLLASITTAPAPAAAKPPRNNNNRTEKAHRNGRSALTISTGWKIALDASDVGMKAGWQSNVPAAATGATVPGYATPDHSNTRIAWYWAPLDVPAEWKGQTVRLVFHAAAENAMIWINGKLIGEHVGGTTPFDFNVTKSITIGGTNLLAVQLSGAPGDPIGLTQPVELISHDEAYIARSYPQTDGFGRIAADILLLNTSQSTGDATLESRVTPVQNPTHIVSLSNQNLHVTPGENVTQFFSTVKKSEVTLWSLDNPSLYRYHLAFRQDSDILDTIDSVVGFRYFAFSNSEKSISLNGVKLQLSAFVAPPEFSAPGPGKAEEFKAYVQAQKQAGFNVLLISAPNPTLLDIADSEGILVVEGGRPALIGARHEDEIKSLVARDRSHVCILGWQAGTGSKELISSLIALDNNNHFILTGEHNENLIPPGSTTPITTPATLLPSGH